MHRKFLVVLGLVLSILALGQKDSIEIEKDSTRVKERKIGEFISKQWELEDKYKQGTFKITPYQLVYFMPIQWTDRPNRQPVNFNPNKPTPEYKDYQQVEAKFQISLKAKIIQDAIFGKGDLWLGFTQTANWQVYNGLLSRPFREMNYEPELIFTYPLNLSAGDFKMKVIGLSVNHQSNGREVTLSRSWNRLILMGAFSYKNFVLQSRFWTRFSEKNDEDDNPEIENYKGRADFSLSYLGNDRLLANIYFRNNLNFNRNRSFVQVSLGYPVYNDMKMVLQFSHGYGSTLVEYNHKQTQVSLGIVFVGL